MRLLLGIDFGTTYFKAGLFDAAGTLRGLGRVRVTTSSSAAGQCELAVGDFWRLAREALAAALGQAGAKPADIAAVSYASQANTFLLLDGGGEPLTPLLVWTDRRATVEPADIAFSATEQFHRTVGFAGLSPENAVVKWRWLQRQAPAAWNRAAQVLTLSDYFTWSLTGQRVGDASTASLLGLYALEARCWWDDALHHFAVDRRQLATPLPPGTTGGTTQAGAAALLGLPAGIPFAVGALDHHAAAVGAGIDAYVDASTSVGTVLAALCLVDQPRRMAGCFHGPHWDGSQYFRLAFHPAGAGELEEFQRRHAPDLPIDVLIAAALAGGAAAGAVAPAATGAWPERAELARVRPMLERMARAQADLLGQAAGGKRLHTVAATGGVTRSRAWLDFAARASRVTIARPESPELACLGAAVFAAAVAGQYPTIAAAAEAMVQRGSLFAADDEAGDPGNVRAR